MKAMERNEDGRWVVDGRLALFVLGLLVALCTAYVTNLFAASGFKGALQALETQVEQTYVRKDVIAVELERLTEAITLLRREVARFPREPGDQ